MIDHLLKFATEAEALADPVAGSYAIGGSWDASRCIADVLVWQPAQDTVASSVIAPGETVTTVEHHPIVDADGNPYWYLLIALDEADPALQAHPGCVLVTDRDKAAAGEAFVLYSPLTAADLNSYMLQPAFAGSRYPFGNAG